MIKKAFFIFIGLVIFALGIFTAAGEASIGDPISGGMILIGGCCLTASIFLTIKKVL